jgi:hemoglobin-like flavoprotein
VILYEHNKQQHAMFLRYDAAAVVMIDGIDSPPCSYPCCIRIFELAPVAMGMFNFADGDGIDDAFLVHAHAVVGMLDAVVNMLGPDLEPLALALFDLGATHAKLGVLPAHYGIVGEALLCTLATALGEDKWTPEVKKGWAGIYTFISSNMNIGADNYLTEQRERKMNYDAKMKLNSKLQQSASATKLSPRRASAADSSATSSVGMRRRACTSCASTMSSDPARIRPMKKPQRSSRIRRLSSTNAPTDTNTAQALVGPTDSSSILANRQPKRVSLDDPDGSSSSTEDLSCATEATTDMDQVNYSQMVEDVYMTWHIVKKIPNYCEVAGVLLFKK